MVSSKAQKTMQRLLNSLVAEGRERGLQLAVYLDGRLVVDAWAGVADAATRRPVDGDTLFPVLSAGKGVAATIMHRLVERGLLGYETPIAEVWPEFAARGKGGITVRHVLGHTAGLYNLPVGLGPADLNDWPRMCAVMADQTPVAPPGAAVVYHGVTYSWLVGETACRAAGRTFEQLLEEEIRRPLGVSDLYIGIPDEVEPRIAILAGSLGAPVIDTPAIDTPTIDDSVPQACPGWIHPFSTWVNRPDVLRACLPSSSAVMTARVLARHYAALLPGGVDGVELLPPGRVRAAIAPQRPTVAPSDEVTRRMRLGYMSGESLDTPPRAAAFGHPGYGGATGFADLDGRLAVGLAKNLFSKAGATAVIIQQLRETLGMP